MNRTEYHVVNARGVVLFTSPILDLAKRWAAENSRRLPGIEVHAVTTVVSSVRVYRPRPRPISIYAGLQGASA